MPNRTFISDSYKRGLSLVLLAAVLCGASPAAAQRRRAVATRPAGAGSLPQQTQPAGSCKGGWSGVVTFKKILLDTRDPGKKKNISRGTTQHKYSRDYAYKGLIVVDGSRGANALQTRSQLTLKDDEKSWKRYEQFEDCAGDRVDKQQMQWSETVENLLTNAFSDEAADFNLRVNELSGTYSFSFRFPEAKGVEDRVDTVTKGGWCTARLNEGSDNSKKSPVTVDGEQVTIEEGRFDPRNPDVITDSKTWDRSMPGVKSFSYVVTWTFKRCPAPVEVTDIRFDEHPVSDNRAWREVDTARGTFDGNLVRVRATVTNFSNETKFPQVRFSETVENWLLPDGEKSIRLEPGESREVELEWDTAGYAWRGKGFDAESYRKIKVEAVDEGRSSQLTKLIVVNPRPVILVHGLWSNAAAWADYGKYFEEGHSAAWKSYAVGADPSVAKMNTGESFGSMAQTNTIEQNANELRKQIAHVREKLNAWHVDIVAHSMGGLIARAYIAWLMPGTLVGRRPVVTRLLMLGTPNQGSPCAELMHAAAEATGHRVEALRELIPDNVMKFNDSLSDHDRRGVRFSALAGRAIPTTCQAPLQGDGVVSIGSARWMITDWRYSRSVAHTDLTSHADFGAFVFPRLSIGPRGNHDPEILSAPKRERASQNDRRAFDSYFRKASFQRETASRGGGEARTGDAKVEGLTMAKELRLAASRPADVEIPLAGASRASIVFVAAPGVSATLLDPAGNVAGRNAAGSAESKQMFRTIAVGKAGARGTWRLKLESREASETGVLVAAFADPNPLALSVAAGRPTAEKQIPLEARLTDGGSPVAGATVRAKVHSEDGKTLEVVLLDDGAHGDGAANDGVYGASLEKPADGDYLIEAAAETNGRMLRAAATLTVGVEKKLAAPAKSRAVK